MYTKLVARKQASTSATWNGSPPVSNWRTRAHSMVKTGPFQPLLSSFLARSPFSRPVFPSLSLAIFPLRTVHLLDAHSTQKACRFQISVPRRYSHSAFSSPSKSFLLFPSRLRPTFFPFFRPVSIFTMERSRTIVVSLFDVRAQREQLPLCINYPLDWPQAPNGRSCDGAAWNRKNADIVIFFSFLSFFFPFLLFFSIPRTSFRLVRTRVNFVSSFRSSEATENERERKQLVETTSWNLREKRRKICGLSIHGTKIGSSISLNILHWLKCSGSKQVCCKENRRVHATPRRLSPVSRLCPLSHVYYLDAWQWGT